MHMGSRAPIAATAACVALLLPAGAGAGTSTSYEGPAAGSAPEGLPSVKFVLKTKKKNGKQVPKLVFRFQSRGIPVFCPSGQHYFHDSSNSAGLPPGYFDYPIVEIPISKKGQFSQYTPFSQGDPSNEGYWVTGSVPKHGPATGTVRIAETLSSTGPAAGAGYSGYCDSGEVAWSADRGG
jgi:hypothetical protein